MGSSAPQVPVACTEGRRDDGGGVRAVADDAGALARDLPETALHVTSSGPTTLPSSARLTCADVWGREVLQGVVNRPRIDGKDGVVDSKLDTGLRQARLIGWCHEPGGMREWTTVCLSAISAVRRPYHVRCISHGGRDCRSTTRSTIYLDASISALPPHLL
jgi:hypothetical protein